MLIYLVYLRGTQPVIFAIGDDELEERVDRPAVVIEHQISYFADVTDLKCS